VHGPKGRHSQQVLLHCHTTNTIPYSCTTHFCLRRDFRKTNIFRLFSYTEATRVSFGSSGRLSLQGCNDNGKRFSIYNDLTLRGLIQFASMDVFKTENTKSGNSNELYKSSTVVTTAPFVLEITILIHSKKEWDNRPIASSGVNRTSFAPP
jgi:hypothetical protein